MPRLRLIIGPPGSGKTSLLLSEIAAEAARAPLGPPGNPPLLLLVPEQQAAQAERAVLDTLAAAAHGPAYSRVQVLSFRWLARRLELDAGQARGELSELGRRLLVWKLLGEVDPDLAQHRARRTETAAHLANLLAEVGACAVGADELRTRAGALAAEHPHLAGKVATLAQLAERYCTECERQGLHFSTAGSRIPTLLTADNFPLLDGTRVWLDGFRDFTPAEERALVALLQRCAQVTASLLLDPARVSGPQAYDHYDWYLPARNQLNRWQELAAASGVELDAARVVTELDTPRRWPAGSALGLIAHHGPQANSEGGATSDGSALAVACTDERAEVDAAARQIRRLTLPPQLGGLGLLYSQISVVARDLTPYRDLIALRFADHGIAHFLDQRRSVAHHPACELLRAALRLTLGCGGNDDVRALLKCDLLALAEADTELPTAADPQHEAREVADLLDNYSREAGLSAEAWLGDAPWTALRRPHNMGEDEHTAAIAQLDAWRRELFAPLLALHDAIRELDHEARTVRSVLQLAWTTLITESVTTALDRWATAADSDDRADLAEVHRGVLKPLAELLDELAALAGDMQLGPLPHQLGVDELCRWLEHGTAELSVGFPPPRLDSVLVTDIERGRHPEVAATLLLGMADDAWPAPHRESGYFSDDERALLNGGGLKLVTDGAGARAAAEPYLALVAATRPTQFLYISRPVADAEGRGRAASPFYEGLRSALGLEENIIDCAAGGSLDCIGTPAELVSAAALAPHDAALQAAAERLAKTAPSAMRGVGWARAEQRAADPLPPHLVNALLQLSAGPPELELRELEAMGACPFQHYAKYFLALKPRAEPPSAGRTLGRFYHRLIEESLRTLREQRYDWTGGRVEPLREAASAALAQLADELAHDSGPGALHILQRASWLLERITTELACGDGREPTLLGAGYGAGRTLHPLVVQTAHGEVRIRGSIDRVDVAQGNQATVIDLRLRGGALRWGRFLAGAELGLPAALLAVRGFRLRGNDGVPSALYECADAEIQRIEPEWKHGAASFSGTALRPTAGQRGADKCAELVPCTLAQAQRILGELGERILSGELAALPLREGTWTACSECNMRRVCRFDPAAGDRYRTVAGGEAQLRERIASGEDFAGSATSSGGSTGAASLASADLLDVETADEVPA